MSKGKGQGTGTAWHKAGKSPEKLIKEADLDPFFRRNLQKEEQRKAAAQARRIAKDIQYEAAMALAKEKRGVSSSTY